MILFIENVWGMTSIEIFLVSNQFYWKQLLACLFVFSGTFRMFGSTAVSNSMKLHSFYLRNDIFLHMIMWVIAAALILKCFTFIVYTQKKVMHEKSSPALNQYAILCFNIITMLLILLVCLKMYGNS